MDHEQGSSCSTVLRRWKWVFGGFLAVAIFFLWTEHRAHLLGVLPYLLVLACPLMHLFHHHGAHGNHHAQPGGREPTNKERMP